MTALNTLKKYFGYENFRPGQSEIINTIISGKHVLAVLPTGAGKSICYQIPGLASDGFSIVISPLIALMKDQVDSLNKNEEIAAFINSTIEFYEIEQIFRKIQFGQIKLLYVAPERLESISFAEKIKLLSPNYLFVDEAHCISEWGHNFRPSYRKISEFSEFVGIKKIAAFTATATPEVVDDILNQLKMIEPAIFVKGFERDNLSLFVESVKHKNEKLLELLARHKTPAIIYTASRRKTEEVAEYLIINKISSAYYHAGMSSLERKLVQENFLNDKIPIIVATNAFGMGIDKKDIRLVVHYNIPGSIENYYQEVGRAGRDGKESSAYLLYDNSDVSIHQFFINNSYPSKELIPKVYDAICNYAQIAVGMNYENDIPINYDYISNVVGTGISKGLINSTLNYLEQSGLIKNLNELEKKFYTQFLVEPENLKKYIKNLSDGKKPDLLIFLLRSFGASIFQGRKAISISEIASAIDTTEENVDEILIQLSKSGLISYDKPSSQDSVKLILPRVDTNRFVFEYKRISDGYINAQRKLEQMVQFTTSNECRFKYILTYFGEKVNSYKCGKCDNCLSIHHMNDHSIDYIQELVLRTLYQTEEGLSENNLYSILCGTSKSENFRKFTTYATCANYTKFEIGRVIDFSLTKRLIKIEVDRKKRFFLTNSGKNLLIERGHIDEQAKEQPDYELDLQLLHLLKEERAKASSKYSQPKFLICSDDVLQEIVKRKPTTRNRLLSIKGFNERTFTKVGEKFLAIINDYNDKELFSDESDAPRELSIPTTVTETLNLINKGCTLSEICEIRGLAEAVISMQIETLLENDNTIVITKLFDEEIYSLIKNRFEKGIVDIKSLKDSLPTNINYSMIRIVLAKLKSTSK